MLIQFIFFFWIWLFIFVGWSSGRKKRSQIETIDESDDRMDYESRSEDERDATESQEEDEDVWRYQRRNNQIRWSRDKEKKSRRSSNF